jgi:hypothetical protein
LYLLFVYVFQSAVGLGVGVGVDVGVGVGDGLINGKFGRCIPETGKNIPIPMPNKSTTIINPIKRNRFDRGFFAGAAGTGGVGGVTGAWGGTAATGGWGAGVGSICAV